MRRWLVMALIGMLVMSAAVHADATIPAVSLYSDTRVGYGGKAITLTAQIPTPVSIPLDVLIELPQGERITVTIPAGKERAEVAVRTPAVTDATVRNRTYRIVPGNGYVLGASPAITVTMYALPRFRFLLPSSIYVQYDQMDERDVNAVCTNPQGDSI